MLIRRPSAHLLFTWMRDIGSDRTLLKLLESIFLSVTSNAEIFKKLDHPR